MASTCTESRAASDGNRDQNPHVDPSMPSIATIQPLVCPLVTIVVADPIRPD